MQHADLRPMPFVVVLVDGDSYRFLLKANTACDIQGRDIAHTLSREISKYILSHPRIPPHSKIVVRIFCNRSSMQGRMTTSAKKAAKATQSVPGVDADRRPIPTVETMVKFAETCESVLLCLHSSKTLTSVHQQILCLTILTVVAVKKEWMTRSERTATCI